MGLLDFGNTVLTKYKADASDHLKELEKLKGAERERAAATIEAQKQTTGAFGEAINMAGKASLAIGAATAAAVVAWDGFKSAMERSRLEAAATGVNIDRLKTATLGLKRETELLRDAARLQTSAFRLTQQQIETVERAMLSYTRQGKDAEKVHESLLQAVTALKTDGLQDLGIFIDKAGLSMDKTSDRAKIFERIMTELAKASGDVKDGQRSAAEGVEATAVSIQDSIDRMKNALGQFVIAMKPLLDSFAQVISDIAWIAEHVPKIPGAPKLIEYGVKVGMAPVTGALGLVNLGRSLYNDIGGAFNGEPSAAYQQFSSGMDARAAALSGQWNEAASGMSRLSAPYDPWNRSGGGQLSYTAVADLIRRFGPGAAAFFAPPGAGGEGGYDIGGYDYLQHFRDTSGIPSGGFSLGESAGALGDKYGPGGELAPKGIYDATLSRGGRDPFAEWQKLHKQGQQKTFLEQTFGPVGEFQLYAKAFQMLTGAVSASLGAWIDGSMSAGEAFKKFIGEALKSLAQQMAIESLKEGAYALAHLALLDFGGAAAHGAAAAAFGAGAAAAAVAARAMGHGGADYGRGGGAGAAAPTRSGSSYGGGGIGGSTGGGQTAIVVYGDPFAQDSPRQRQISAERMVRKALGSMSVEHS